jgi:hypothetical protein
MLTRNNHIHSPNRQLISLLLINMWRAPLPGNGPTLMRFQQWLVHLSVSFSSPVIEQAIEEAARQNQIPLNYGVVAEMLTDAWGVEKADTPAVSSLLSLPRRYSHSPYEVIDVRVAERRWRFWFLPFLCWRERFRT